MNHFLKEKQNRNVLKVVLDYWYAIQKEEWLWMDWLNVEKKTMV